MPKFELDGTLGSLLVGGAVSSILFGLNCQQTLIYYQHYERDPRWQKALVFTLWILDSMILIFVLKSLYFYCVTNFVDVEVLALSTWELTASILTTSLANAIIRCFFVHRIYILGGKRLIIPLTIMLFSFGSLGASTYLSVKGFNDEAYSSFKRLTAEFYTIYGCAVIADSMTTASFVYYLWNFRTGIQRTNSLLTFLILFSINTGLLTCLTHLTTLITFVTMDNFIYVGIFACSTKCYYGTFLANLNSRDHLRVRYQPDNSNPLPAVGSNEKKRLSGKFAPVAM